MTNFKKIIQPLACLGVMMAMPAVAKADTCPYDQSTIDGIVECNAWYDGDNNAANNLGDFTSNESRVHQYFADLFSNINPVSEGYAMYVERGWVCTGTCSGTNCDKPVNPPGSAGTVPNSNPPAPVRFQTTCDVSCKWIGPKINGKPKASEYPAGGGTIQTKPQGSYNKGGTAICNAWANGLQYGANLPYGGATTPQ